MRAGRGPEILLALTAVLVAGASGVLVAADRSADAADRHRVDVHRATGGLGLGATLDLSDCPHGFDPRLDEACARRGGPLPGDDATCPHDRGHLPLP